MGRFAVGAARSAGMSGARLARIPHTGPDILGDGLVRVPTSSVLWLWEQVILTDSGTGVGAFAASRDLIDAFRVIGEYIGSLGDPGADQFEVVEDGALVTVRYSTGTAEQDVVTAVEQFGIGLMITRARAAAHRDIRPVSVSFRHRAPAVPGPLAELLGTRNIAYGAPANTVTFLRSDVAAPLPGHHPGLLGILRAHADSTLAEARPVRTWLEAFHAAACQASAEEPNPSLATIAARMGTTTRTLQRRLAEHGTTWRTEAEAARAQRACELIRASQLPLHAIAARTGYSDPRALRRAVRRWHGVSPSELRQAGLPGEAAA
ncbi:AraC family transcriptional regulator [Longispora albida]|uniref:AraC family transcriptional regulator n=1 Tax=Longispora albida TaxID=203523 RepID=UPI0003696C93|nr:helix-turn-helix domain-containing protein [Longispora albida]